MEWLSLTRERLRKLREALREVLYGMTVFELEREIVKEKETIGHFLMLIIFGDMVGIPVFPPYYSLRLLPFVVPQIGRWKRVVLRERDLTDIVSGDL